ncbi:conserved hypothetical protein [Ruegeria lacuscaerulensis ITI-1157]|nr:conserved hypothetical protein [Ruegeria lacuscaerulensis ITI-1157]SHK06010.1 Putative phage tail protein [Ruegeria lacuscaerulensis ITI-1157]
MRNRLLLLAFLGTTALTPRPAEAAPVVGFVAGALGISASAAAAAGISAGFAAGATFGGSLIGGFVVKTVVAVGLSKIAQKLRGTPSSGQYTPATRMANFAQPVSYAETVYGRTRKGGPLGFTGFKNSRRYYVPILAAHQIEGIAEHWLDERQVTLNSNTGFSNPNIDTFPMRQYGRIEPFLGAPGQAANAGLMSVFPEITSAHDFAGLAGAVVWAKKPPDAEFSDVYPRGRQWAYTPVIDGKNTIYDPRTDTTGYTNNAALVIADWIVNILGVGVDWDEVAAEADICDELVTNAEGGTQPRWTINGTISDDQEFEEQRAILGGACDAYFYERPDGKLGFRVGRWIEPDVTLGALDLKSFELSSGQWGADAPTEVSVVYTEPENGWRETPSGAWVESTTERQKREELQVFTITSHNQAARIAKRLAKTKRSKYSLRGEIGLRGYDLLGKRFFRMVQPEIGFDQYFEIGSLTRDGIARFTIEANSVEPEDFEFDAAIEEPTRPTYLKVSEDATPPDSQILNVGSSGANSVDFIFAPLGTHKQRLRIRRVGTALWRKHTLLEGDELLRVTGLIDGAAYKYQARPIGANAAEKLWLPDPPATVTVVDNPTAPAAHEAFSAILTGANIDVLFTAPNDPNYFATRIYRALNSTNFGSATLVHTEYGIPSNNDSWTDVAPASGDQSYWIEPINSSGVAGPRTGPQTVTIP